MKINVLTYNVPHRKTQDTLFGLRINGYDDVRVIGQRFKKREKQHTPLLQHRPSLCWNVSPEQLCDRLGYNYIPPEGEGMGDLRDDLVLIAGSGILPQEFVDRNTVINSHPAYLPYVRGLDSYKWAIYENLPIGVTTHIINEKVDEGKLIQQEIISPYLSDTFFSLAMRQYEREVQLLVSSIEDIKTSELKEIEKNHGIVHRRMPSNFEIGLLKKFDELHKFNK